MSDGHEKAVHGDFAADALLLHHEAGELLPALQRRHGGVHHKLHVLALLERLDQLLLAAKAPAPVDEIHLAAALAEQQRVLQGAVAAAADRHGAPRIKGAVADRAVAHAAADQLLFAFDTQHPGLCAGGQDQRMSLEAHAGFAEDAEALALAADLLCLLQFDLGPLGHGLLQQLVAQLRAGHGHEAREILHLRAPGDLAAEGVLFNDQHALARAAGVGGRGQPRWASADDKDVVHPSISLQHKIASLPQKGAFDPNSDEAGASPCLAAFFPAYWASVLT